MRYALAGLALAAALCSMPAAAPAADAPATPALTADSDTVRADDQGSWSVTLTLSNPLDRGIYADSLILATDNQDPGASAVPRQLEERLDVLARNLQPTGAHERNLFVWTAPATFDFGRLTYRLFVHDGQGAVFEARATLVAAGGVWTREHPSGIVRAGGRAVEVLVLPAARDSGRAPGVVLVHDDAHVARGMLPQALALARLGYAVALVSRPGFGRSDGPADMNGAATTAALSAALDTLERRPGVDPGRIAVWGLGSGGTAALLVAAARRDVRAAVAVNATYDLWADYRAASPEARHTIEAQAGRDSAAWRARSPALLGGAPHCPVLVLHDSRLELPSVTGALAYAQARRARGAPVEWHLLPTLAPRPWRGDALHMATAFLNASLAP